MLRSTLGVERLCDVEADLTNLDDSIFKERNKQFWKRGDRYLEVSYQVKLVIGSADILLNGARWWRSLEGMVKVGFGKVAYKYCVCSITGIPEFNLL